MLRQLTAAFFLLLCAGPSWSQIEPAYVLKHMSTPCADEKDAIDIADAWLPITERFKVMMTKVLKGACSGGTQYPERVTSVTERHTPAGHTYYCFNLLEIGKPSPSGDGHLMEVTVGDFRCAPANMLTTVDAELAARTGDYDILTDFDDFAVSVSCREGGLVKLRNDNGTWFRTTIALPWRRPYFVWEVPAGQDRSKAIRDGCKGADVQ